MLVETGYHLARAVLLQFIEQDGKRDALKLCR
jgi:hypothetical protein